MSPDNTNIKNTTSPVAEDEIDLIQLAKTLWVGRRIVIKITLIFMALGLFIALFSAKEYTASTTMVPQSAKNGSKMGNLGGLAAMAGINLGSAVGGSTIPPTLYPKIITSVPFQKEMMKTSLTIKGQKEKVSFQTYYLDIAKPGLLGYIKKYTIGLPRVIIKAIKGNAANPLSDLLASDTLLTISQDEKRMMNLLTSQLSIEVNSKDGYVTILANMPEARPAAEMVNRAQILLQEAITEFKIQKAKDKMVFVEERYSEKKAAFTYVQNKLARFRDQNKNVSTAMAQTQMERLQSEFSMASSVYTELAKQLETQKIQVKEDTPVFTIIDPVSVPLDRSKPKRSMILIIWTFLGGIVGVGMVFGKHFLGSIKEQWSEGDSNTAN